MRHLLSLSDWSEREICGLLATAARVKKEPQRFSGALTGRILLMVFQKPSLRTRVSFEAAMLQLGGHAIHYDLAMSPWSLGKESAADMARTASRYVDAIMARLYKKADLDELAAHASVPLINGLTDVEHPCQALGDLLTISEKKGRLKGVKLAYVGDGNNNVTHSLLDGGSKAGMHVVVASPWGTQYQPADEVVRRAERAAQRSGGSVRVVNEAAAAVAGADVVYTDTWFSYHIPPEHRRERMEVFAPFQVTAGLMKRAAPDAIFMHCLPAQRGEEQTAEVIDGPQSVVFDQAENRLHTEKAVLLTLLGS